MGTSLVNEEKGKIHITSLQVERKWIGAHRVTEQGTACSVKIGYFEVDVCTIVLLSHFICQ